MCDREHYSELDERVTKLEGEVSELRAETRTGFSAVNSNIETLSQQITNMDRRIIDEKQKWGETLRGCVKWVVRGLVAVAIYAAGVNLTEGFIAQIFCK